MALRITGITVALGGNVRPLSKAVESVNMGIKIPRHSKKMCSPGLFEPVEISSVA